MAFDKKSWRRNYRATHLDQARASNRLYARAHPEMAGRWSRQNPSKRRAVLRASAQRTRATPNGRINHRVSTAMNLALKGQKKGRGWESLAGFTLSELIGHIESRFKPGMNWKRFACGQIQIDHILPKAAFHFTNTSDSDFRRCWALENLAPEWKRSNLSKGSKIRPSQIALGI